MKKIYFLLLFMLGLMSYSSAQKDTVKTEKVKKGFSINGVPVVAYDTDIGFKYGIVLNFFHYGDGSNYPNYNHSLYMEWSNTTKGSMRSQLIYDTRTLIPKTRMTLEGSYLTEQALDFYGFNGYQADYNPIFADDSKVGVGYISRMYYRQQRKLVRFNADFQGELAGKKLRWLAGFSYYDTKISSVDIAKLNKGKSGSDLLPDTASLYDKYVQWGVIDSKQKNGGTTVYAKAGLVYDTRDNEANPNRGLWDEIILIAAPAALSDGLGYSRIMITHRQYFTLIKKRLTFAYRLSYQSKLTGDEPFYMLPYFNDSKMTQDGLGGAKNLRGIMRNRVVGDGFGLANLEFRWKFLRTLIFKQNFYIALSAFTDAGMVTSQYKLNTSEVTAGYGNTQAQNLETFDKSGEGLHLSYGGGLHFAINENFIIAVDYGRAVSKQDGVSGLYIGLNFIF
jgi:outer membrane protein assembly factor BamA